MTLEEKTYLQRKRVKMRMKCGYFLSFFLQQHHEMFILLVGARAEFNSTHMILEEQYRLI